MADKQAYGLSGHSSRAGRSPDLFSWEDGSSALPTTQGKLSGKGSRRTSQTEGGLREALKEALEAQEHFRQKAQAFSEALTRETRRSERLQQEKEKLLKGFEKMQENLSAFQAEVEELRSQKANLESRNVHLTHELKRSALSSSPPLHRYLPSIEDSDAATVLQYLALVVERLEACPELRALYQGRVPVTVDLAVAVSSGESMSVLTKILQVMSDFISFYGDFGQKRGVDDSVEKLATGTQTTLDRSIITESPALLPSHDASSSSSLHLPSSPSNREQHFHLVSNLNRHSTRLDELTKQLAASQKLLRTQRPYYDASFSQRTSKQDASSGSEKGKKTGYHSSKTATGLSSY